MRISLAGLLAVLVVPSVKASSWIPAEPLPEPRWFHAAGVGIDQRLYVYGGEVRPEGHPSQHAVGIWAMVIYDPLSGSWSRAPELSYIQMRGYKRHVVDRIGAGGAMQRTVVNKEVEVAEQVRHEVHVGRADPQGRPRWYGVSYWIPFEPLARTWGEVEAAVTAPDVEPKGTQRELAQWLGTGPSFSRYTPTAATSGDSVYLSGGLARPYREGSARPKLTASVEVWEAGTNAWHQSSAMGVARYLHAAAFDRKGRLFVFGGSAAEPSTTQKDGESTESFRLRAAEDAAKADTSLASVEMYDPRTNTWSERAPLPTPRQAMGADLGADGRIYVVGGAPSYAQPRPMAVVEIYDPESDTWETGPSMNYARRGHAVVATPDGKLYAIGGFVGRRQRTLREQLAGDFVDPALGATMEVLDTRSGQ